MINRITFLIISIFWIPACTLSQEIKNSPKNTDVKMPNQHDTLLLVNKTDTLVGKLDSTIESLVRREFDLIESESSEGGHVVKYYDGDLVRLINLIYYGETGQSSYSYYLDGDQFVNYILQEDTYFDKPIYYADYKEDTVLKNEYYLYLGSLIYWRGSDQKVIDPTTLSFKEKKKELLNQDIGKYTTDR